VSRKSCLVEFCRFPEPYSSIHLVNIHLALSGNEPSTKRPVRTKIRICSYVINTLGERLQDLVANQVRILSPCGPEVPIMAVEVTTANRGL